jgi:hypothetical protein
MPKESWRETYIDGSPEAERLLFLKFAQDMLYVQLQNKKRSKSNEVLRTFHSKLVLGVANGKLEVAPEIPSRFQIAHFKPGAQYEVTVRLSNANGRRRADAQRDMRGAALRIKVSAAEYQDLLMTNFPVSHARDARQFVAFAKAVSGSRLLLLPRLVFDIGPLESVRILRNVLRASKKRVSSLALEAYWSRGAILWGDAGPMRYLMRPISGSPAAPTPTEWDPDYLSRELANRLRKSDVVF